MKYTTFLFLGLTTFSLQSAPIINIIAGTNTHILTTNRPGGTGVDVQINTAAPTYSDTNLAIPLRLVIEGDSLSAASQAYGGLAWPSLLTNYNRSWSNMYNMAIGGTGVTNMLYGRYTNNIKALKPVAGEQVFLSYWGGMNDINTAWQTTAGIVSNELYLARQDGFKIVMFDIPARGDYDNTGPGSLAEYNRRSFNKWARESSIWDYFVPISDIFSETNSMYFFDHVHYNLAGQFKIMDAFIEAIARGKKQVASSRGQNVIASNRWLNYYTEGNGSNNAFYIRGSDGNVGFNTTNLFGVVTVSGSVNTTGDSPIYNAIGDNASFVMFKDATLLRAHGITATASDNMLFRTFISPDWRVNASFNWTNGLFLVESNAQAMAVILSKKTTGPVGITNGLSAFWNSNGLATYLRTSVANYNTNKDIFIGVH